MIIGIAGTIAAGKETLTGFFREKGFIYLESSQVIKDELRREGREVTRESMQDKGDELRAKYGVSAIMIMLLDKTRTEPTKNYIFDSLRNDGEAEFMRKEVKNFILIGVDAPKELRFKRTLKRAKPSDPKTWEEFLVVDGRDQNDTSNPLGQQTRKLIENSDFVIFNDKELAKSKNQVEQIWEKLKDKILVS